MAQQGSLDVADAAVSPRRAAAARDDVTEDEWTQGHRPDPLGAIKTGRHMVAIPKATLTDCLSCRYVHEHCLIAHAKVCHECEDFNLH